MLRFHVLTIFPQMIAPYLGESILARAIKNKKIAVRTIDIRKYTSDKHHSVDDKPYGGGAGMLMKVEPIFRAVSALTARKSKIQNPKFKTRIILFSAKGKQFTQRDAMRLSKYDNIIMICGRYEGVDERVAKYVADEEISVGPYVLSGGELPALTVIDAVSRLVPGVLGNRNRLMLSLVARLLWTLNSAAARRSSRAELASIRNTHVPKYFILILRTKK